MGSLDTERYTNRKQVHMNKIHYSIEDLKSDAEIIVNKINTRKKNIFSAVYGVPRGGIPFAIEIANQLNIPIIEEDDWDKCDDILIVDDIVDSGKTRDKFRDHNFACIHQKEMAIPSATYIAHPNISDWVVYPWEENEVASIGDSVLRQLQFLGEDVNREGLKETPARVVKSWKKLYGGYNEKPENTLKIFKEDSSDEIILLKNIEIYSTCEHHMLPFFGKAHIAYIPNGKVVGISKLARLLEIYTRRLQIQERIAEQITTALMKHLNPLGAACIIEAQHFCMMSRGIEKQNSSMTTSSLKGVFLNKQECRAELMGLIR